MCCDRVCLELFCCVIVFNKVVSLCNSAFNQNLTLYEWMFMCLYRLMTLRVSVNVMMMCVCVYVCVFRLLDVKFVEFLKAPQNDTPGGSTV